MKNALLARFAFLGGEKPKRSLPSSLAFLVPPQRADIAVQLVLAWFENPKRGRSVLAFSAAKNRRYHISRKLKTASAALDSIYKGGDRLQRALGSHKSSFIKGGYRKKESSQ